MITATKITPGSVDDSHVLKGMIESHEQNTQKQVDYEYKASAKICAQCELRKQCTRAKEGRTLKRHARQDELDIMLEKAKGKSAKRDIKHRQDLSERSFAWSKPV